MNPRIGVLASLKAEGSSFQPVRDLGLQVCQLSGWEPEIWSDDLAERLRRESASCGVRMSAFWAGWPGPKVWDFVSGPTTLGIVPREYREIRVRALLKAAGFASRLGAPAIITHLGFIPENASDPAFAEVVSAVRRIAVRLQALGMQFWFETGQETPVTMLRLIRSVGTGNLGINLDPANLILYGKGDPVDSLDVFGIHGIAGILGALGLCFFLRPQNAQALAAQYGPNWSVMHQLGIQGTAVGIAIAYAAIISFVLVILIDKTLGFRLDSVRESAGMDHALHGEHGYGLMNLQ